jgi:DNA-binding NtrC family response regulator
MENKKVIFIVEDDPGFNKILTSYLTAKHKWDVHSFQSGEEAIEQLNLNPEIFLQDFDLPKMNGIEVMKQTKRRLPNTEFIFLSGQTNIKVAVEALQLGAYDYIVKDGNAKENALNKIDQIIKFKNLMHEKQSNKMVLWGSLALNVIILIILAAFFYLK